MEEVLAIENILGMGTVDVGAAIYKLIGLFRRLRDILDFEDNSLN